jgi:hypothetical protein
MQSIFSANQGSRDPVAALVEKGLFDDHCSVFNTTHDHKAMIQHPSLTLVRLEALEWPKLMKTCVNSDQTW